MCEHLGRFSVPSALFASMCVARIARCRREMALANPMRVVLVGEIYLEERKFRPQ